MIVRYEGSSSASPRGGVDGTSIKSNTDGGVRRDRTHDGLPQPASREGQAVGIYGMFLVALPGGELYENTTGVSGKGGNRIDCTYRRRPRKDK